MCYNKEVSIVVFIFAIAVVIKLINDYKETNDRNILLAAVYITALSLMQLVEFFVHMYTFKNNPLLHKFISLPYKYWCPQNHRV